MKTPISYTIDDRNPGERKRFVRGLFDDIVPTYDLVNRVLSLGLDRGWRRSTVLLAGELPGKRVLDLCCGTGDLSVLFGRRGAAVFSVDFSREMILEGTRKGALQGGTLVADACRLPVGGGRFHVAAVAFGLRNIPDLVHFLDEVHRVLVPGGRLLILELTRPSNPIVRLFFSFYLHLVLPLLGGLISGKPLAYRYLSRTIATYPDPRLLEGHLRSSGFQRITHHRKCFGAATITRCERPLIDQ